MRRSLPVSVGGAARAADLGSSSKYSYEKQTLNAEVEEVSPTTAFARGLVGNLSLTGNLNGDLVEPLSGSNIRGQQALGGERQIG